MTARTTPSLLRLAVRFSGLVALATLLVLALPVLSTAQAPDQTPAEPAGPLEPPFALTLDPSAAVVTGLAPGGEALVFSIAREPLGYLTRVSRRDEVVTADETGTAIFVPTSAEGEPVEVPSRSVWVAVDLETGALATAVSEGFEAPRRGLPAGALRRGPSQRIDRLADRFDEAQMVFVRPGDLATRGIWGLYLMDGSRFDEDGATDGFMEVALDQLLPLVGSGPPPDEILPGDVVAMVDPNTLAFFASRLDL